MKFSARPRKPSGGVQTLASPDGDGTAENLRHPRARKIGSRREFRDVTPEVLRRIRTSYGIDLDFPEADEPTRHRPPETVLLSLPSQMRLFTWEKGLFWDGNGVTAGEPLPWDPWDGWDDSQGVARKVYAMEFDTASFLTAWRGHGAQH